MGRVVSKVEHNIATEITNEIIDVIIDKSINDVIEREKKSHIIEELYGSRDCLGFIIPTSWPKDIQIKDISELLAGIQIARDQFLDIDEANDYLISSSSLYTSVTGIHSSHNDTSVSSTDKETIIKEALFI